MRGYEVKFVPGPSRHCRWEHENQNHNKHHQASLSSVATATTTTTTMSLPDTYDYYDNKFFYTSWAIARSSATLSMLGSGFILQSILRDPSKRVRLSNQIMMALSCCDLLASFFSSFLGSWPAPEGVAPRAIGNVQSCVGVSFFNHMGFVGSTYYNASLAICYLLMVRYNWSDTQLRNVRKYLLLVPVVLTTPFSILGLAWGGGNFNGFFCSTLAPSPKSCTEPDIECIRGTRLADSTIATAFVGSLQIVLSLPIIIACMVMLYLSARKVERANDRYRFEGNTSRQHSRRVAVQGILYVWAFLIVELTWVSIIVLIALRLNTGVQYVRYTYFTSLVLPLQGFLNALVYLRPRYVDYLRTHPEKRLSNILRRLVGLPIRESREDTSRRKSSTIRATPSKFYQASQMTSSRLAKPPENPPVLEDIAEEDEDEEKPKSVSRTTTMTNAEPSSESRDSDDISLAEA